MPASHLPPVHTVYKIGVEEEKPAAAGSKQTNSGKRLPSCHVFILLGMWLKLYNNTGTRT